MPDVLEADEDEDAEAAKDREGGGAIFAVGRVHVTRSCPTTGGERSTERREGEAHGDVPVATEPAPCISMEPNELEKG
jgi:hypothetical protein